MKPSEIILGILRIPVDFLMAIAAFLVAYQIRGFTDLIPGIKLPLDLGSFPSLHDYLWFSGTASVALIIIFAINKMYSLKNSTRMNKEIGQVIILTSAWLMLIIAYFFIMREFPFSRLALGYSWLLTILFVGFGRGFIRLIETSLLHAGIGKKRILFIGSNNVTEKLANRMKKDPHYFLIGLIDDKLNRIGHIKALGKINELSKIVQKYRVEEIIQTKPDLTQSESTNILEFCRENHLTFRFVPDLLAVQQTNIDVATVSGIPVISLKPTPLDGWGRVIKRAFDIFGSTLGLIILSPIFLISAIAIKLDSKGTILFKYLDDGSRAKRIGQYGKPFNFYKFRTMYPNTHSLRYTKLAEKNVREGSPMVKIKDDPRVTKIGKFLRKTSIDELPQLVNVLRGNMSMVGPRPHLPEEVAKYQKHHRFVLSIKPGITGIAQISGRSDLDFEEEMRLDTFYIEHWSLWLDIKIIFATFGVIFKGYQE